MRYIRDNPGYFKDEMKSPYQRRKDNERISTMRKKLNDLQAEERDGWKTRMANIELKNKARWNKEKATGQPETLQDHKQMFEEAVCIDEKIRKDLTKAFQRLEKIDATLDASLNLSLIHI